MMRENIKNVLIGELVSMSKKLGRTPKIKDIKVSGHPVYQYYATFGSFANALEAAKLDVARTTTKPNNKYSDAELISMLQNYAEKLGRTPRMKDVENEPKMPSAVTYVNRFGCYKNALIMANLSKAHPKHVEKPKKAKDYTDAELIAMLQNYAKKLGRTPKIKDVENEPEMPSAGAYVRRFGSYTNALIMANLERTQRKGEDKNER